MAAPIALLSPGGGPGPSSVPDGIPAAFVPVYRESARAFHLDWLLLAAVHQQETGFSTNPTTYHGLNAAGLLRRAVSVQPHQRPAIDLGHPQARLPPRRRARPHYPHPQPPHPSVYDDFDAAMAAGALLRGNGADATLGPRTFQAVRAYNGAGPVAEAYARRVIDRARLWQTTSPPSPSGAGTPPSSPTSGAGELTWPVRGPITSPFCERRAWEACHPGIDIAVPTGTPILAAATGRVTTRGPVSGYGLYTCLQHRPPLQTCYAHQSRLGPTPSGGIVPRGAPRRLRRLHRPVLRRAPALRGPRQRPTRRPAPLPHRDGLRCRVRLIVLVLLVGVLAGCQDPYQQDRAHDRRSPARAKPALPQTPHGDNVSSRAPARDTAPTIAANARATARSAVNVFCAQWTNWSWRTIGRQQRRLAALATGPLARQLAAEAQARAQDQALRRDRLGARGHVVAIDVKRGQRHAQSGLRGMGATARRRTRRPDGRAPPRLPRHRHAHARRLGGQPMAAAALAARVPLLNARRSEAAVACGLAFDEPGGPLIAVCGLVGGAGASTLALCLARQAAHESAAPVLLTELAASSAGLAVLAGQASALSLGGLAQQVADGQTPARAFVELEPRLRLLASPPLARRGDRAGASPRPAA